MPFVLSGCKYRVSNKITKINFRMNDLELAIGQQISYKQPLSIKAPCF